MRSIQEGKTIEELAERICVPAENLRKSIERRAGILTCPGGLVTNDRLQVLDTENKVIDGLYVAGNTVVVSMVMTILSMASRQLSQVTQADVL